MATNPDLNIVDTLDNATIGQLQQAQQLASSIGNTALSAIIGNAITFALASAGGGGVTTPGQTGNGTPVGPTVTTPAAMGLGIGSSALANATRTTAVTTTIPAVGGSTTPVQPGTPGTGVVNDLFVCPNPTYRLGKTKELKVGLSYDPNSDFASLNNAKQCVLIGEIIKCCPSGETFVGYTVLGYATVSRYYEDCPDGGRKPVIKQYYDIDKISIGGFVLPYTDNLLLNTIADPFISSTEASNVYRGKWSDDCNNLNLDAPLAPKSVFNSFEEYFNSKYPTGLTLETESRRIENSIVIYNSSNRENPKQVDSNILRGVKASCEYEGQCIKTDKPGPSTPCQDTWNINTTFTEDEFNRVSIPSGYIRTSNTSFQTTGTTIVSGPIETVPNNPCYKGTREVVQTTSTATYTYEYKVREDCIFTKTVTVTKISDSSPIWRDQFFDESKKNLKECKCEEQLIDEGKVLLDPNDPCGCKQYNLVKVRLECPDGTVTDSTEIYRDGIPAGLNLPAGIKLNPYIPFVLRADCQDEPIKIYHPLILGKDIVEAKITSNTRGLFNLSQSISCYLTSSLQSTASQEYYYEITDCDCDFTSYFAVAYGHISGSGSLNSVGETNDTATRAIYSQYRLLALEEPERKFKFYNNGTLSESDDIYAINFYRNALSDRIDPGNFEVALRPLNGGAYANNVHTGSNVQPSGSTIYTFIDNSGDRSELAFCSEDPYVSYDIVSGSLDNGIHNSGTGSISTNPNITTYGRFYPNLGIMIFDPTKMDTLLGFNTVTGSNIAGNNAFKLYTSISGSGNLGSHMKARNVKFKTTNHYFVRVSPPNANYSNNPTFISDTSTGKLLNTCFQKEPVTYVTSIGLYNDRRELLAIAKLSKPTKKTPDDDLLIKIRLNW